MFPMAAQSNRGTVALGNESIIKFPELITGSLNVYPLAETLSRSGRSVNGGNVRGHKQKDMVQRP